MSTQKITKSCSHASELRNSQKDRQTERHEHLQSQSGIQGKSLNKIEIYDMTNVHRNEEIMSMITITTQSKVKAKTRENGHQEKRRHSPFVPRKKPKGNEMLPCFKFSLKDAVFFLWRAI